MDLQRNITHRKSIYVYIKRLFVKKWLKQLWRWDIPCSVSSRLETKESTDYKFQSSSWSKGRRPMSQFKDRQEKRIPTYSTFCPIQFFYKLDDAYQSLVRETDLLSPPNKIWISIQPQATPSGTHPDIMINQISRQPMALLVWCKNLPLPLQPFSA